MAQGSAINDIMQMRQQGLSNNQVIQNLQRQGYTNTQIFDAMNQADTKMAVEGMQPGFVQQTPAPSGAPMGQDLFTAPPNDVPGFKSFSPQPRIPQVQAGYPQEQQSFPMPSQQPAFEGAITNQFEPQQNETYEEDQVKIEELVEAIIEEKWAELIKDVNKIIDWKNKVENRLAEIEIKMDSLKDNFNDLNSAILGKVNEYDRHILEIGSDINAMEKAFSKVLPVFTENVNELSRIANKMKSGGQNEKPKREY